MRFFVAITDYDWFQCLSALQPDEVNFWQPSGSNSFKALQPGEPLLFKLHSPRNFIVGGGFFSSFSALPISLAWNAFETKNGAQSFEEMRQRVWKYRDTDEQMGGEEVVGCIMLQQPFFLKEPDWIPVSDWPRQIVRGKGYDTDEARGAEIWQEVQHRLANPIPIPIPIPDESVLVETQRYGQPQIFLPRLGQGAFRVLVTDSYLRKCALSSSHILHILEAAHIKPFSQGGTHSPTNGLLLRQDIHTLFDRGYITVTPELRVEVSRRIREEFNNGEDYYKMQGRPINLPELRQLQPSLEALTWHNERVFRT
ncbi:MAG: HNH endonuclease [Candidatus Koribacter versatilis]|uniref:HNH endonuclease n=1 Tax=Candidatus Korobacter versatilis TaxID=658062 RepID=A0A932A5V7_9BACT|nr:HNH endonuclease [Candidatus Koribacter versatilis]